MLQPDASPLADTKDRILRAAEALFVETGFVATSLRMITAAADVNLAAVNYHFGSKEALIQAVFERRLGPINRERVAQLDRLEAAAGGEPLTAEQVVDAMVSAALRMSRDPVRGSAAFLRLLGRAFSEPAEYMRSFLPEEFREVVVRFQAAFARALPDMPEHELIWRMHFMFGAMAYAMAGTDALRIVASCDLGDADDGESIIRRLIPFLVGGFKAPLPEGTGRAPAKTRSRAPVTRIDRRTAKSAGNPKSRRTQA